MSQQLLTLQSLGTEFPAADCCISFSYYQCLLQDQYFSRLITKTDSCLLEKVCFGEKKEKVCVCFCGQEKRVRERHWTLKFGFKFHFTNSLWTKAETARHFTDSIPVAQWHISMSVMFQIFETTPCNNKDRNHCLWCHMGQ